MEKTFAKGLTLMETLVAMQEPASVTRLANMLGLYKSNVHRLLRTLLDSGFVVQVEGGRYMPSLRLTEMGEAVWNSFDLSLLIVPALATVTAESGQPALLLSAERGGFRIRGAVGITISGSLPIQGSARILTDLLRQDAAEVRAVILPLERPDAQTKYLCLVPVPDLSLPAPMGLALIAADEGQARAMAATACDLAGRLSVVFSGSGPFIAGRAPVSA